MTIITWSDKAHLAKEKAKTDAEYYKTMKEAEANKVNQFVSLFTQLSSWC